MALINANISPPLNNINGSLVNVDGSNYSGSAFTSNVIPSTVNPNVMTQPLNNVQAAASHIPCIKGGGRKKNKISRKYRMRKYSKRRTGGHKKHSRKSRSKRSRRGGGCGCDKIGGRSRRKMRGGYSQYQNNMPMTQTFSTGGPLSATSSATANPPPYQTLSNCTNCVDNYNHFTNSGFPSRGSY